MEFDTGFTQVGLIEPPMDRTANSSLPPFQYEKLLTPTSIRLLKIDYLPKNSEDLFQPITCSLVIKDLNHEPVYDALSYTWGDPLGREPSNTNWATTPFSITCKGHRFDVTTNLHTALIAIRHYLTMFRNTPSSVSYPNMSRYIWVDQICINQKDIAEKNSQVQLMGRGHQQYIDDLQYIQKSLEPLDWDRGFKYRSYDIWDRQACEALGIRPITREKARGMFDFFNRAWFKRSWIIQEALVKHESIALCGLYLIPFHTFPWFMTFLEDTGWLDKLFIGVQHPYPENMANPIFFRNLARISYRLGIGNYKEYDKYWNRPFPINTITSKFRDSQATDPRDKVYAFIGISENDADQKGPQLIPDYSKTVDDVYIEATKLMMSSKGFNLDCFSQKEDQALCKINYLPSWVPDFSVAIGHNPLVRRHWAWAACGTPREKPKSDIRYLPSNCVELVGTRVDAVKLWKGSVVQEKVYSFVTEVAIKACEQVHISANDVVELMALVPETSVIGPPSSDLSLIDEYEEKNHGNFFSASSGILKAPDQVISYQSRSEVFWRTMIKDIKEDCHPAKEECGKDVFKEMEDVLCNEMALLICRWPPDSMTLEEWKDRTNEVMKEFTNLLILRGVLPYGTTDTQNPKHFAGARSVLLASLEKGVDDRVWRNLLNYLSIRHEISVTAKGRGLFVTVEGRLGWGLKSTREGDEVWILDGCQVPCLLRPNGDGRYSLVGEAYVHGIMHGEALEGLDVKDLSPVIIV
ncbi:het-domain-containing protein [Fusarium napiforme]|uniref:Het-domain-containing protein n=1 Tax=Fusarium napiforme TaxID=42672 RepID=A0A8H5INW7_9HYPO|nr:het-domain-containing protein [Fusarium napiforme]